MADKKDKMTFEIPADAGGSLLDIFLDDDGEPKASFRKKKTKKSDKGGGAKAAIKSYLSGAGENVFSPLSGEEDDD